MSNKEILRTFHLRNNSFNIASNSIDNICFASHVCKFAIQRVEGRKSPGLIFGHNFGWKFVGDNMELLQDTITKTQNLFEDSNPFIPLSFPEGESIKSALKFRAYRPVHHAPVDHLKRGRGWYKNLMLLTK